MPFIDTGSSFVGAWKLSGHFLVQTLTEFARHPGIILLYAAPPATERAWVMLRNKPVPAWWLPWPEVLMVIWRLLLCAVAVWIMLTPLELVKVRRTFTSNTLVQAKLGDLGASMGRQLWLLSWEIVFFLSAFFLAVWVFGRMARLWMQGLDLPADQKDNQRLALAVVARNLLLYPLALMYAVALVRHYFRT